MPPRPPTRALELQPVDWIDRAPVALRGEGTTTASPEAVFAVLADHERWPEWFPNVKEVLVTGPAAGVGATRRVRVPGMVVDEEFIVWEPGVRWCFTGTAARPAVVRSIVEDCRLTPTAAGGAAISYTMYLDPAPGFGPLVWLGGRAIRASIQKAVTALGERAARASGS
jgi:uncharacterized protein YndB with AHSA1/START domain